MADGSVPCKPLPALRMLPKPRGQGRQWFAHDTKTVPVRVGPEEYAALMAVPEWHSKQIARWREAYMREQLIPQSQADAEDERGAMPVRTVKDTVTQEAKT